MIQSESTKLLLEGCTDSLNSGVALYFSNSTFQSSSLSGGMIPVTGRHSVMLSPDSVSRVTPPTMMTAKTNADEKRSQLPTAGGANTGSLESFALGWAVSVDKKREAGNRRALSPSTPVRAVRNEDRERQERKGNSCKVRDLRMLVWSGLSP